MLHDNGCISIRRKEKNSNNEIFSSAEAIGSNFKKIKSELNYPLCAQSDQVRLYKNIKVFGFAVCPTSQKDLILLLNDGRLLKFEIFNKSRHISNISDLLKIRRSHQR